MQPACRADEHGCQAAEQNPPMQLPDVAPAGLHPGFCSAADGRVLAVLGAHSASASIRTDALAGVMLTGK